MTVEQFKDSIECYTDFTVIVNDVSPNSSYESVVFEANLNKYIRTIEENLSEEEFKKFQKALAVKLKENLPTYETFPIPYPDDIQWRHGEGFFRQLANDDQYAPFAYVQDTFTELVKYHINDMLKETIVEYFSVTNTLPPATQIFEINLGFIYTMFDEFPVYDLDLGPLGAFYYLKQCAYKKSSNQSNSDQNKIGDFEFQLCLWNITE